MARDADIVVVGAGIVGAATARALAGAVATVVLVEQFELGHDRGSSHGRRGSSGSTTPTSGTSAWRSPRATPGASSNASAGGSSSGAADRSTSARSPTRRRGARGLRRSLRDARREEVRERWPLLLEPDETAVFQPDGGIVLADRAHAALVASAAGGRRRGPRERTGPVARARAARRPRAARRRRALGARRRRHRRARGRPGCSPTSGSSSPSSRRARRSSTSTGLDAEDLPSVIDYARTPTPATGGIARVGQAGYALAAPGWASRQASTTRAGRRPGRRAGAGRRGRGVGRLVGGVAVRRGVRTSAASRRACTRTRPTRASSWSATGASSSGPRAPATASSSRPSSAARSPLSRARRHPDFRTIAGHDAPVTSGRACSRRCGARARRAGDGAATVTAPATARRPRCETTPRRRRRDDRPSPSTSFATGRSAPVRARSRRRRLSRGRRSSCSTARRPRRRDGLVSAIPDGTRSRTSRSPTASPRSTSPASSTTAAGARRCSARVAQVVATLTRFPTIERVGFRLDGEPVESDRRRGRRRRSADRPSDDRGADAADPGRVAAPRGHVSTPIRLRGTANVFEATVSLEVRDAAGRGDRRELHDRDVRDGHAGTFEHVLELPDVDGPVTIVAFEASAEDGRPLHVVRVPVTLAR